MMYLLLFFVIYLIKIIKSLFSITFFRAAKENILEILKEATRKDCNTRDDGGMTPTLWSAFEGHIEALRLLVAKGGDPDKADYFGNTALHLAAARGHELCVRFLVKFGCNIWSLDIDRHSARELAAINGRDRILQFLDLAQADQELNSRKKSRLMKDKAEKEAEKRLKEYVKRQKLAESRAEKEQKKLLKQQQQQQQQQMQQTATQGELVNGTLSHTNGVTTFKGRMKPSPTYSDIVGTATKRHAGIVGKKALAARRAVDDFKVVQIEVDGKKSVRSLTGLRRDSEVMYVGTYDTNTLVLSNNKPSQTNYNNNNNNNYNNNNNHNNNNNNNPAIMRRGKISDVWGSLNRARSTPDLLGDRCPELDEEEDEAASGDEADSTSVIEQRLQLQEPASIFNRPGFGSVAFRRSIASTLDNLPVTQVEIHRNENGEQLYQSSNGSSSGNGDHLPSGVNPLQQQQQQQHHHHHHRQHQLHQQHRNGHNEEISIGSAGSLARRQSMWDDDLISDEDETDEEWTPLQRFLVANNLASIHPTLEAEQIDLEALMLLTENDIAALKLPLGPRRKLLHAIASRKKALEAHESVIKDIRL
ncbi:Usher syndrome type-1G protein homolog isoform X1 [Trichogramma pretiosum]|uniref:Usher syndrome type-1G protein homolog isoform X1 n=1 Tax=Trichogramma pretiosum TaxID=7493 RepID=UPI000C71C603|nr:Usher syndrome type-1G protein homolog isoform X1 [Trichogramma pretiosum]